MNFLAFKAFLCCLSGSALDSFLITLHFPDYDERFLGYGFTRSTQASDILVRILCFPTVKSKNIFHDHPPLTSGLGDAGVRMALLGGLSRLRSSLWI